MKLKLYIFAISHYCEKARWALDHLGIDHEIVHLAPGLHVKYSQGKGLENSSLPILEMKCAQVQPTVIQGSDAIIDWAEKETQTDRRLTPVEGREKVRDIEKRLDDRIGVHVRRVFYSEALVEFPKTLRPIFTKDLSFPKNLIVTIIWPRIREKMIKRMDLGYEQGEESKQILAEELDWLESQIEDENSFLVGETLSRADITAAALLARLATPADHPTNRYLQRPPRLEKLVDEWNDRPALRWARRVYKQHRN